MVKVDGCAEFDELPTPVLESTDILLLGDTTLFHLADEPVTIEAVSASPWSADLLRTASSFRRDPLLKDL